MGGNGPTHADGASGIRLRLGKPRLWRRAIVAAGLACCGGAAVWPSAAWALDKVTFGTNWLADP
ncbi:MAG TPA: hypothetical protein VKV96_13395, partial [Roseiarcus sp.]|nr:hypothetical protein [Roseiarcus sp.]